MTDAPWSSDVPISMPMPVDAEVGVRMSGFAFTEDGMAHDITGESYQRLATPTFAPKALPNRLLYEDDDVDDPPSSMEIF